MNTIVIEAAASSAPWPTTEAPKHRLQEFVLELLAAIVLIALFMAMTAPETRTDADANSCRQSDRWLVLEDFARPCRACAFLAKRYYRDLGHFWTRIQGKFEVV